MRNETRSLLEKIFNIDRRIIFVVIAFAVIIPFLVDFDLPIVANKNVKKVYDKIEEVGAKKGTILMSFDYDNSTKAELDPAARALLAHAFSKGVKVVAMGNWPTGVAMTKEILLSMSKEFNKEDGVDWAYMGYKSGAGLLMLNLSMDFQGAFPVDAKGIKTSEMPITKNIRTIKDFDYVLSLSSGNGGIEEWIIYSQSKFNYDFGGVCTAVGAPDYFPFLQAGQLNGLIGGLAGAAQYEALINRKADAVRGMKPQSVVHIVLILFILFGNVCYLANSYFERKRKARV